MNYTILVVDDDPQVQKIVAHRLRREGYRTINAGNGEEALLMYERNLPDLVVLDLLLSKLDGFEVCRKLRETSDVPIVILSAKGDELDKTAGFRLGVDDYVTKPFSPSELALRIGAILKRTQGQARYEGGRSSEPDVINFGDITLNRLTRKTRLRGEPIHLTAKEFDLCWILARHPGQVFSREQLLEYVWPPTVDSDPENVTVLVSRLREKVEDDPKLPQWIETVWGQGYRFTGSTRLGRGGVNHGSLSVEA